MICCRCHRRFVEMVSHYNSVTYSGVTRVICDDCFGELDDWMIGDWALTRQPSPMPRAREGL